jgi:uncharacterized protein YbjT (DUF2867 family)
MGLILVTGATGNVGRRVVSELTSRGAAVRAFVRDRAKAAEVLPGDVEVAIGDFTIPDSVRDAFAGVDRVFLTSANGPDEVTHETAVIEAAVPASVRLLVKLSALGAQVGSPRPGLDWHGQIEQHLRQSGLPAVVLQSNLFMSNLCASADAIAGGALPAPAGDAAVSFVDPADVAAVASAVLVEGRSLSEPLMITGPTAVSYAQIADELATATGRPVHYIDLPPGAAHQAFTDAGLPPWLVTHLDGAYTLVRAGELAVTTDTVQRYLNRPAHTIEEWAHANAEFFGNQVIDNPSRPSRSSRRTRQRELAARR